MNSKMIELTKLDYVIINALNNIDSDYYATAYNNIQGIEPSFQRRAGELINNDFYSYGERIFCYEFYHQLKVEMENPKNMEFFKEVSLQGEARKMNIIKLLEKIGLESFSNDLVPDLLIHNPSNGNNQMCAIEIKTKNNLSTDELQFDLGKLYKYCKSLNYENVYFIAVNTSSEHINNLIKDVALEEQDLKSKIKIICKENRDTNPKIWQL